MRDRSGLDLITEHHQSQAIRQDKSFYSAALKGSLKPSSFLTLPENFVTVRPIIVNYKLKS